MDLKSAVIQIVTDVKDGFVAIAPLVMVIGFMGVGIMYAGSGLPLLGDWKRDNPKAANYLIMGLAFVAAAGSVGTLFPGT